MLAIQTPPTRYVRPRAVDRLCTISYHRYQVRVPGTYHSCAYKSCDTSAGGRRNQQKIHHTTAETCLVRQDGRLLTLQLLYYLHHIFLLLRAWRKKRCFDDTESAYGTYSCAFVCSLMRSSSPGVVRGRNGPLLLPPARRDSKTASPADIYCQV